MSIGLEHCSNNSVSPDIVLSCLLHPSLLKLRRSKSKLEEKEWFTQRWVTIQLSLFQPRPNFGKIHQLKRSLNAKRDQGGSTQNDNTPHQTVVLTFSFSRWSLERWQGTPRPVASHR